RLLEFLHLPRHFSAGTRAGCEDDIRHPRMSAQIRERDGAAILVGEREIGNLPVNRQGFGDKGLKLELGGQEGEQDGYDNQRQPTPGEPLDFSPWFVHCLVRFNKVAVTKRKDKLTRQRHKAANYSTARLKVQHCAG